MLTGFQCETVAYYSEGGLLCVDCAVEEFGALAVSKSEDGIGRLSPVSRYGLEEFDDDEDGEDPSSPCCESCGKALD